MKIVICLALLIVCVATEYCRDGHDEDCNSTVCSTGFRPDCHHVVKKHIDAYICTCKVTDKDFCIDDAWCATQNSDKHCRISEGNAWHCSNNDKGCRCHCDHPNQGCDDDDDK